MTTRTLSGTGDSEAVSPGGGLSRRRLVGAAAHAAWAAPVIMAASAAPSYAASGPAAVTTQVTSVRDEGVLTISVTTTNANTGSGGPTSLVVTATPNAQSGTVSSSDPMITTADGWTFGTRSGNSGGRTYNFSRADLPGASSSTSTASTTLVFTVPVVENLVGVSTGRVTAVPTTTEGGAAGSASLWT